MTKKTILIIVLVFALLAAGFGFYRAQQANDKSPIYISVTVLGKAEEHEGTARALNSVQLYLDQINAEGGVNGHPFEMLIKVDGGEASLSPAVALETVNSPAMISLGNTYSDAAEAAGKIYAENHMPVMTSGATAPKVTEGNDWFFRVVNDNTAQGIYIAEYAYVVLGYKTAIIAYEDNSYGESLRDAFTERFEELGGEVFQADPVSNNDALEDDVKTIISSYQKRPDMVFLATYKTSGLEMLAQLRNSRYRRVSVIGGDDVGDSVFATRFLDNGGTNEKLDNTFAASPLIFDVGSEGAQRFRDEYIERYGDYPTWFSATTYDSAIVAVDAIRNAGISGDPANLASDRELVRDYLDSIDTPNEAIQGITGNIYFTGENNFVQPMAMGTFQNGLFISAPLQVAALEGHESDEDIEAGIEEGTMIEVGEKCFYVTQIVYVGIDINEFNNVDIDDTRTFLVDFYLWFRFNGDLDLNNVLFDNSVETISLDSPMISKEFGDTSYRLFRIRDSFTDAFNLSRYPFDKQKLSIRLRHNLIERKNLIFVVDTLGLGDVTTRTAILESLGRARAFDAVNDWQPTNGFFFADTIHDYTTRGNPAQLGEKSEIEHSRFNASIEIKRDVMRFTAKTMLPVLCIIVLAYLGLFLPNREFETITSIMTGTVLSVVFFHVDLSGRLNVGYTVALDYAFYAIYALLATELFISIVAWHKSTKEGNDKTISILFWTMRLLYPIVLIGGVIAIIHFYEVTFF